MTLKSSTHMLASQSKSLEKYTLLIRKDTLQHKKVHFIVENIHCGLEKDTLIRNDAL